jgi:hypothetical protein
MRRVDTPDHVKLWEEKYEGRLVPTVSVSCSKCGVTAGAHIDGDDDWAALESQARERLMAYAQRGGQDRYGNKAQINPAPLGEEGE